LGNKNGTRRSSSRINGGRCSRFNVTWNPVNIYIEREKMGSTVHVEEDLEARVEALIGDLEPEVVELLLGDALQVLAPPPRQGVEDAHRELLGRVHHSCGINPEVTPLVA
jgi:hypothetical protein